MTTYEMTTATQEEFNTVEAKLIADFESQIINAEVHNTLLGSGKIVACVNTCNNFDSLIITVYFDLDETKHYNASVAFATGTLTFADEATRIMYETFKITHTNLVAQRMIQKATERAAEYEANKKAKADAKAEERYARLKEKSINDFNALTENTVPQYTGTDEFFYALGWLYKYIGTISAAMPDYLKNAFDKYFGAEAPCRVVDSSKRGPAGYQSQWTWSFRATLKKHDSVPSILIPYLNDAQTAVVKTTFVWDLVDKYGFKFGKRSKNADIDDVLTNVPVKYVSAFYDGMNA